MPFWLLRCMSTQEKSGEVKYDNDPLAYVGQDEILPCCCRPCGLLVLYI